ncbi:protein ALP1-like [Abeliophyllum distichum]|uniref:Protein ALP1-like n=1 Tax=Abeliophyllum distichum TaxID=126358 RepID=A0ABD1RW61_9LAMI
MGRRSSHDLRTTIYPATGRMVTAGRATKRTTKKQRKTAKRFKTKTKTKLIESQRTLLRSNSSTCHHHKHLSKLIPLLIATTSSAHSFLLRHDLDLLPSQSLALESLLSSTAISLTDLHSLLSFPVPTT